MDGVEDLDEDLEPGIDPDAMRRALNDLRRRVRELEDEIGAVYRRLHEAGTTH